MEIRVQVIHDPHRVEADVLGGRGDLADPSEEVGVRDPG